MRTYNNKPQKNQTDIDAEKDHLVLGHEPTMSVEKEPEHAW
jgi:hypothetical protein